MKRNNFTEEMAMTELRKMPLHEQVNLLNSIIDYANMVIASNQAGDDPCYTFWSNNQELFRGVDITDFMAIDNKTEFANACIYYTARYINMRAGR